MKYMRLVEIVKFIDKLIRHNRKYIRYRITDRELALFIIYNYYYVFLKQIHPSSNILPMREPGNMQTKGITGMYDRGGVYRLSTDDKRCILMALYSFNKIEHDKFTVSTTIKEIFKLQKL